MKFCRKPKIKTMESISGAFQDTVHSYQIGRQTVNIDSRVIRGLTAFLSTGSNFVVIPTGRRATSCLHCSP